jgi:hypothetical protein
MIDDYAYKERIAIKMDSHIPEREAIIQTKREMTEPECVIKANAMRERVKLDHADKMAKKANRFNYE